MTLQFPLASARASSEIPLCQPSPLLAVANLFEQGVIGAIKAAPYSQHWTIHLDVPTFRDDGAIANLKAGGELGRKELEDNDDLVFLLRKLEGKLDDTVLGDLSEFRATQSQDGHLVLEVPIHEKEKSE